MFACAERADNVGRLACYDAAIERLQRAHASGDLAIVGRSQARQIEREAFGFSLPSLPGLLSRDRDQAAPAELREARSEISQLRPRRNGRAVFTMADGQIWEQIDTTNTSQIRAGRATLVRRAALGSYVLSAEGAPAAIRVSPRAVNFAATPPGRLPARAALPPRSAGYRSLDPFTLP